MKWISAYFLTCTFLCATLTPEPARGTDRREDGADSFLLSGDQLQAKRLYALGDTAGAVSPHVPADSFGVDEALGSGVRAEAGSLFVPADSFKADKPFASEAWSEADSLFEAGNWFEAGIAYERIYFWSERPGERAAANLRKAGALKQQGEFSRARRDLQRSLGFGLPDSLAAEVLYQLALCAYLEGDIRSAESFLLQRKHRHPGERTTDIYLLEGLVMLELQRWDALREHLLTWLGTLPVGSESAAGIVDDFDAIMASPGPPTLRDPERARLWSTFIPGSGQLYAGSAGWASLNLLSQLTALGGFGLLAYNGYYVASVVMGLGPFQSLYFGGIRQAGNLADRNNKSRQESFRAALGTFLLEVARLSDY